MPTASPFLVEFVRPPTGGRGGSKVMNSGAAKTPRAPGRFRWRWLVAVGSGAVLLLFILGFLCAPFLGSSLVYQSPLPEHVDAAVVLSGSIPDRAMQAVDLVRLGIAGSVLIVNDPLDDTSLELRKLGVPVYTHSELNRFILLKMDVPEERIQVLPQQSASTWEDALALRGFLETNPLSSVAVVTCRYHTYRSWLNFRRALEGLPVELYVVPASLCSFEDQVWWRSRRSTWRVLQEWLKLGGYLIGYR